MLSISEAGLQGLEGIKGMGNGGHVSSEAGKMEGREKLAQMQADLAKDEQQYQAAASDAIGELRTPMVSVAAWDARVARCTGCGMRAADKNAVTCHLHVAQAEQDTLGSSFSHRACR